MVNHRAFGERSRSFKMQLMPGIASVINDHDMPKAGLSQSIQHTVKLVIRVQGRQNNHTG